MAVTSGQVTTADRTVGVKVDMDEALLILPVDDVPLQRWMPSTPTSNIRVDWMEEVLTPQTDTISAVSGTTTPWTATVSDGNRFRVGDILHKVGAAAGIQWTVTAISTNDLTLASFGTTTNSDDPAAADVLEIVGQLLTEGQDPLDSRTVERSDLFNYTQIGQEKVEASRTARKQAMYSLVDPYTHEQQKKFRELAIRFERSLTLGQRYQSGKKRAMGGVFYYFTNGDSAGSAQSQSGVVANAKALTEALIRSCWEAGGAPTHIFCSPAVKAAIVANYDAALRRAARTETTVGFTVETIVTPFGDVDLVADRYIPTTKALVLQREFNIRRVFDGYQHEVLAKTGDGDKGEIVGEFSFEEKNRTAQGVLTLTDAA